MVSNQLANPADQDWRKGRPSCSGHHFPACRGCGQWRPVPSHPGGHPAAPRTAGSRMTASVIKSERKRLSRSAQTGVDQTQSQITLAAKIRNRVQIRRQMPEPRLSVPIRIDRDTKRRQHAQDGILLGECRVRKGVPLGECQFNAPSRKVSG